LVILTQLIGPARELSRVLFCALGGVLKHASPVDEEGDNPPSGHNSSIPSPPPMNGL
jgi:hypothetical protein